MRPLFLAVLLTVTPAIASADTGNIDALHDTFSGALNALTEGNLTAMIEKRPPAQLQVMIDAAGTTRDALLEAHAERVRASLELVEVEYAGVLPERTEQHTTPSGLPYVIVWTEEYWRSDEHNLHRIVAPSIAVLDGETWYFTPLFKARDKLSLRRAYPDFIGVDFPEQRMQTVWENTLPPDLNP